MANTKNSKTKGFKWSHIEAAGRAANNADYVLNRTYEELTGYLGEDLTYSGLFVKDNTVDWEGIKEKYGKTVEEREKEDGTVDHVTDYGFSFHKEADLNRFIKLACESTDRPEEAILYNKEKDYFYQVPPDGAEVIITPEEVVSAIVDYALEFSDENDDWRITGKEKEGKITYLVRDDLTDLEAKLNKLEIAPNKEAAKKNLAEALPILEETYEGLTFPGKAQGTKKEKEKREEFLEKLLNLYKHVEGAGAADFLTVVSEVADVQGADFANAFYAGQMKLPLLSKEAHKELAGESHNLFNAYESFPDKPRTEAERKDKEAAYQKVLSFYALESQEAEDFVKMLDYKDRIVKLGEDNQRLRTERSELKTKNNGLQGQVEEAGENYRALKGDYDALFKRNLESEDVAVRRLSELEDANSSRTKWRWGAFGLAAGALAIGAYAGHQLASGDESKKAAQHEGAQNIDTEPLTDAIDSLNEKTIDSLKKENGSLKKGYDQLTKQLAALPSTRAEVAIGNPLAMELFLDDYLPEGGNAYPGPGCDNAAKNLARSLGVEKSRWKDFADTLAQTSGYNCQSASQNAPYVQFKK